MADLSRTVKIIFSGKDDVSKTVKSIQGSIDKIADGADAFTAPFATVFDTIIKIDGALALLTAGGLFYAAKASGEFAIGFNTINTLIHATDEELAHFRETVLDYAGSSTQSIDQINIAIYEAISAGVAWEDSIQVIAAAEQLAVAGKAELVSTTNLLTGSLNAYGASADQAADFSDVLFQTVKDGKTTIPELALSLSNVTAIAANAGIDFATLGAAVAGITATGAETANAVTFLKGAITNIIKPSVAAKEAAAELGIEFGAQALAAKGLPAIMQEIYEKTEGNIEPMAKLFGNVRGLNGALTLSRDAAGAFARALGDMETRTGSTIVAFAKMKENIDLVVQGVKNALVTALVSVGDELVPSITSNIHSIGTVFNSIEDAVSDGAFDPIFDIIREASDSLDDILGDLAGSLPEAFENINWGSITRAWADFTKLLNDFFDDFDPSDADQVAEKIQLIVDAVAGFLQVNIGLGESLGPIVKTIGTMVEQFNNLDDSTKQGFGNITAIGKLANSLITPLKLFATAISVIAISLGGLVAVNVAKFVLSITGASGLVNAILALGNITAPLVAAGIIGGVAGGKIGEWMDANIPLFHQMSLGIADFVDELDGVNDAEEALRYIAPTEEQIEAWRKTHEAVNDTAKAIDEVQEDTYITIYDENWDEIQVKIDAVSASIVAIPEEKIVTVSAETDIESIDHVGSVIITKFKDGITTLVSTGVDDDKLDAAKKKVDDAIPAVKVLEIETDLKIAQIKSNADVVRDLLKFKAEVDIAEIDANAKKVMALAEATSDMFINTGNVLGGFVELWAGTQSLGDQWTLESWIDDESARRDQLLKNETELTAAEVDYIREKTRALQGGEALISVTAEGLEPELEAFMWKILERVQIRAVGERSEFLLGLQGGLGV